MRFELIRQGEELPQMLAIEAVNCDDSDTWLLTHAPMDGLYIEDDNGEIQFVSLNQLLRLFNANQKQT